MVLALLILRTVCESVHILSQCFFVVTEEGSFNHQTVKLRKSLTFFRMKREKKLYKKWIYDRFFSWHAVTLTKLMYHKLKYEKKCWKNGDKKRFNAVAIVFVGIRTRGSIQWHVEKSKNNAHTHASIEFSQNWSPRNFLIRKINRIDRMLQQHCSLHPSCIIIIIIGTFLLRKCSHCISFRFLFFLSIHITSHFSHFIVFV